MNKTFSLSEIANVIDCEHKTAPTVNASIYYSIRTTDISNGRLDFDNANRVSHDTYIAWTRRATPKTGDLILAREAPVGEVGYIKTGYEVCLGQRTVLIQIINSAVDKKYLLYYLVSPQVKHELRIRSTGSVVAHLNMKDIRAFPVSVPSLPEQKAITAVLSSLDDKIDLLHRQNKTLESLAQTLFRHWFIDNAADDWEDGCLGDISENIRISAKYDQIPSGTIYIGLEHIDRKSIALNRHGLSDTVKSNKYQFIEKDILFGKLRPYFHKVCFTPFTGICSTDILVLRPKKSHYFCFSLFAFYQNDVIEYANLGSGGTRMPRTNWNVLKDYQISIPPENMIKKFEDLVYPSIKKIRLNLSQINTLEKLRDTLLPKLMSGTVRVRQN